MPLGFIVIEASAVLPFAIRTTQSLDLCAGTAHTLQCIDAFNLLHHFSLCAPRLELRGMETTLSPQFLSTLIPELGFGQALREQCKT
jgi:hypothetical protein